MFPDFSPEQLVILGLVASAVTMILRFIYEMLTKAKVKLPQWVMLFFVFAVSVGLSVMWFPQVYPPLPIPSGDPAVDVPRVISFLAEFVTVVSATLGFAKFVYDWLIVRVKVPLGMRLIPSVYKK